jgi:myosin heavy subunit
MLVPSSSRTSEIRDMANKILTTVLGVSKSEGLDKYQLGLTEIFFRANMLAFLENLRTTRLNHCATVIQKNLKAKYYRRKYLEARNAILLIQSVTRRHLAWKHTQETRRIKAATTIQRVWRGQKQRKSFNAIRNNVILIQAAAKGFLRRREIMDTRVGKAAVLIQRAWHLRRHMKSWRQYRRKVVIVQSLWRGKCARRRCEKIREAEASSDAVGQVDHRNNRIAELPAHWRTQLQRIKSIEVLEDCQRFCYKVRHPVTSIDVRPDQDALERSGGPDKIPTRDRRLKQLKFIIEDGWEKEKSLEIPKIVLQVSRRIHLVELTANYMEEIEAEKAAPKKRRRPSVRERFIDLLFPYTIKYKSKKARKGKKGRKVSDQKGQQVSEEEVRERAEKTFEYWIRLGKPLWRISERYGLSILVVLPKEVTETR